MSQLSFFNIHIYRGAQKKKRFAITCYKTCANTWYFLNAVTKPIYF